MSKPAKLSNRTKRKIRAELTAERLRQEERNRHVREGSVPVYCMKPEEKESVFELAAGAVTLLLLPVVFGLATLIFGG